MKLLLIGLIRAYRILIRPVYPKTCLYKESCSIHVERITRQDGTRAGLNALRYRMANCRLGYHILEDDRHFQLITQQRMIVHEEDINPVLLEGYSRT